MHYIINKLSLITLLLCSSLFSNADALQPNEILRFELSPYKNTTLFCDNKTKLAPEKSDFSLINYSMMSSDKGERYVLASIRNTAGGQRILKAEHIIAIFADCSRVLPIIGETKFEANTTKTIYLPFGINKHPILQLQTSNNESN